MQLDPGKSRRSRVKVRAPRRTPERRIPGGLL